MEKVQSHTYHTKVKGDKTNFASNATTENINAAGIDFSKPLD